MRVNQICLVVILVCSVSAPACKDDTPQSQPIIEITFPEEGALLRETSVRVRGTAENVEQLEVDGEVAEVVGGEWEALVPVSEGEVTLTAKSDEAQDTVSFTVDSRAPALHVTSPERALYMQTSEEGTVTVSGTVFDEGSGLELIKVGEQIVQPDASGQWQWELALEPGLNEITVTARDAAGNETEDIRGLMYGDFIDPASKISPGFDIWLDQTATDAIEAVIAGFVTGPNLMVMAAAFESDSVEVNSIELDPVQVDVELRRGVIQLDLQATNVSVQGNFTLSGDEQPITIDIARLGISVGLMPVVTEEGLLDVTFTDPVLELTPEDLSYNVGDLSDEDNEFLENLILNAARSGFGYVLSDGLFASLYDPDILKRRIAILDREIAFDVAFEEIDIFADGGLFRTSVTMPAEKHALVRDSPGALHRTPGPGSGVEPTSDLAFTVTENGLDRILHGVWYSGLLHHELAGNDFAGIELPFELNAAALATVIDSEISTLASGTTPAGLRLRPQFAPVSKFDTQNSRLLVQLGEFMVDLVLLPPGQEPIPIATLSTFFDLSVRLKIEGVLVRLEFDTVLRADLAYEPTIDVDDEKTEALLEDMIALIPGMVAQGLDLAGEADITWMTLKNPQLAVHGVDNDYATVNLDMEPNPQELEAPEPPENPNGM